MILNILIWFQRLNEIYFAKHYEEVGGGQNSEQ